MLVFYSLHLESLKFHQTIFASNRDPIPTVEILHLGVAILMHNMIHILDKLKSLRITLNYAEVTNKTTRSNDDTHSTRKIAIETVVNNIDS